MMFPKDHVLLGLPVREAQRLLEQIGPASTTRKAFCDAVAHHAHRRKGPAARGPALEQAEGFWDEALKEGLLGSERDSGGIETFHLTTSGLAAANATIGSGYTRQAAEAAVAGFLERCAQLEDPASIYPYRVEGALAFGSYITGKERVVDVDIIVQLVPRHATPEERRAAELRYIEDWEAKGHHVPWNAEFGWVQEQTLVFLRNRSRILSFVAFTDAHVALARRGPHDTIYP